MNFDNFVNKHSSSAKKFAGRPWAIPSSFLALSCLNYLRLQYDREHAVYWYCSTLPPQIVCESVALATLPLLSKAVESIGDHVAFVAAAVSTHSV